MVGAAADDDHGTEVRARRRRLEDLLPQSERAALVGDQGAGDRGRRAPGVELQPHDRLRDPRPEVPQVELRLDRLRVETLRERPNVRAHAAGLDRHLERDPRAGSGASRTGYRFADTR
jgi:hypothetical protein